MLHICCMFACECVVLVEKGIPCLGRESGCWRIKKKVTSIICEKPEQNSYRLFGTAMGVHCIGVAAMCSRRSVFRTRRRQLSGGTTEGFGKMRMCGVGKLVVYALAMQAQTRPVTPWMVASTMCRHSRRWTARLLERLDVDGSWPRCSWPFCSCARCSHPTGLRCPARRTADSRHTWSVLSEVRPSLAMRESQVSSPLCYQLGIP